MKAYNLISMLWYKNINHQVRLLVLCLAGFFIYSKHPYLAIMMGVFFLFPVLWLKLGTLLGHISTTVIMSFSYVLVLLPFSLFVKSKQHKQGPTFVENIKTYSADDMVNPF